MRIDHLVAAPHHLSKACPGIRVPRSQLRARRLPPADIPSSSLRLALPYLPKPVGFAEGDYMACLTLISRYPIPTMAYSASEASPITWYHPSTGLLFFLSSKPLSAITDDTLFFHVDLGRACSRRTTEDASPGGRFLSISGNRTGARVVGIELPLRSSSITVWFIATSSSTETLALPVWRNQALMHMVER